MGRAQTFLHSFLWALVGWLALSTLHDARMPRVVAGGLQGRFGHTAADRAPPLVHPRGIRRARGIGRLRALDVTDWAWAKGGPYDLEGIPGVGPVTAGPLREAAVTILKGHRFRLHSPMAEPR